MTLELLSVNHPPVYVFLMSTVASVFEIYTCTINHKVGEVHTLAEVHDNRKEKGERNYNLRLERQITWID